MAGVRTTEAVQAISSAIAPYIGETMARAATLAHLRKLGVGETEVREPELDALLRQLLIGLNVFVGRARSAEAIGAARLALTALGGGP